MRLNRFEEFKQEDIDWLKNILLKRTEATVNHVLEKRGSKLKKEVLALKDELMSG